MKKIILVVFSFCIFTTEAQTPWQSLQLIPFADDDVPIIGTSSPHGINFFTNNTQHMSLNLDGLLQVNNLAGIGNRILQVDQDGTLFAWTGSIINKDYLLHGDGQWKLAAILRDGNNLYTNTGTKLGIGVMEPQVALDVDGDVSSNGKVKALSGFLFNDQDAIKYDPTSNSFYFGKSGFPIQPFDACSFLPSAASTNWIHANGGGFASSQINPVGATNVNAILRMYISALDGNGFIEVNGKDNNNSPNNSLNLNVNCGRVTNINTGAGGNVNIGNGLNGNLNICPGNIGNVGVGMNSVINTRLGIKAFTDIGFAVNTRHAVDNLYNTKLTVDRDYTKALSINNLANNPLGDENFIIYGDGRTRIGGDYLGGSENSYKLSVNGSMIAEEVVIMLRPNWPDYVFSENYKLLPLNKVEEFINKNAHLPNIPSAIEIKNCGLSTGEMLTKQMEKIEELTLYLIELKKEIELIRAESNSLKGKLK